ncbi:MAG TPA: GNAT family N-acetyltransferase [Saprospiraceae bacterium]|nr:GNAT family N-acetyltransferase [Saprospiraceae bacterium]HRG20450.1 GNAT family N-acetyltransferase [Saprospiraceae bacterium]HRG64859.1 GNAT family N-acetyltransferase [Saprospiraceae bacterium]
MAVHYLSQSFQTLSVDQLYAILGLRSEVFIVEQNCPYQDLDGRDAHSIHIMGLDDNGKLVAYCRLLPPDLAYPGYSSIGRVITSMAVRGSGEGKKLMEYAIREIKTLFPAADVKISAQCYALPFYEALGFVAIGDVYLEDDIPHQAMVLKA